MGGPLFARARQNRAYMPEKSKKSKVAAPALADVESLLYHGYLEEDVFLADWCLSFRTLSSAEEREMWMCYRNVRPHDQVHFVVDLLAKSLHRVNGRRVASALIREFFWRLPRSLLLGLYRLYRTKLSDRVSGAQAAVEEYSSSPTSRSLWGAFRATGTLPSPDFDFKNSNVVQHLWFVVNVYRDESDTQKAAWNRSQYIADQICMFLDPKGFQGMRSRRDARTATGDSKKKEFDAEVNILTDILEMMSPASRRGFVDGIRDSDPADMAALLHDRISQKGLESEEEYKERVCEALTAAIDAVEAEESVHMGIMQEKTEKMALDFMRELRAKLALRNLRILLEIMGREGLEEADYAKIKAEVDVAIAERGSGYTLRYSDEHSHYEQILKCEGLYKHCAFLTPERRVELLEYCIGEDIAEQVRPLAIVDPYLLRKANTKGDTGPRGDSDGPPLGPDEDSPSPPPHPPNQPSPAAPAPTHPPASDRPDLAEMIHRMAEEYRDSNPGIDDAAKNMEGGEHIVETMGHWEDTALRKASSEPPPDDLDSATTAAKEQSEENRRHGLEEDDAAIDRRDGALSRRNDAIDALNRAKKKAGLTPEMEREAFLENIRRVAHGEEDPGDPGQPSSPVG